VSLIADSDELRERISAWPEEERAAALFALQAIEDELAGEVIDRPSTPSEGAAITG
jgi:hypothetical protein